MLKDAQAQRRSRDHWRPHRTDSRARRQRADPRNRAQRAREGRASRRSPSISSYGKTPQKKTTSASGVGLQRKWNKFRGSTIFAPILILLVLIVAFLYLHFTSGSGLTRMYLAGALVLAAILILLPSLNIRSARLVDRLDSARTKIQLGLDLQGGTHLLMEVKLDDAVKTQLGAAPTTSSASSRTTRSTWPISRRRFRQPDRQAQVERRSHAVPRPRCRNRSRFDRFERHRPSERRPAYSLAFKPQELQQFTPTRWIRRWKLSAIESISSACAKPPSPEGRRQRNSGAASRYPGSRARQGTDRQDGSARVQTGG